ncbi:interleukin-15 receptor subunit alpha isoform X2 [Mixophyes fleayi]
MHVRYLCQDGYKRQAGTSNLALCIFNNTSNKSEWKYGSISCIRDPSVPIITPSITHTQPTTPETFIKRLSTPAVNIHNTPTSKTKATQLLQDPGPTPTIKLTTVDGYTTSGQTTDYTDTSTERISTPAVTIHETPMMTVKVTQFPQDPGWTPTIKLTTMDNYTTPGQATVSPDKSLQAKRIVDTVVIPMCLIIIIIVAFALIYRYRRSQPHRTDIQVSLRHGNTHESSLAEHEEESTFL